MPENEKDPSDEKLLILPLGEESKKITQVISNDTARQIIELLADVLKKYLGVILAAVLASSFIEFFMRGAKVMQIYDYSLNEAPVPVQPSVLDNGAASQAAPDIFTNLANTITAHPGLLFLTGCLFMVALLIVMDYRRKRKNG